MRTTTECAAAERALLSVPLHARPRRSIATRPAHAAIPFRGSVSLYKRVHLPARELI